jgi:hypothetical protein
MEESRSSICFCEINKDKLSFVQLKQVSIKISIKAKVLEYQPIQ